MYIIHLTYFVLLPWRWHSEVETCCPIKAITTTISVDGNSFRLLSCRNVTWNKIYCCILYFGWLPRVWISCADVSKHCSIFIGRVNNLLRWNRQSVPKRQHKIQKPGKKKEYNIHNTAKALNEGKNIFSFMINKIDTLRCILCYIKIL